MTTRLVLVGLGHAHLFVLEAAARGRLNGVDLTVVTGDAAHVYSGMVPGWIRDRYTRNDLSLDVPALCAWAGARHVAQHAVGLDEAARQVRLANGESCAFEWCSVAVGSRPAGLQQVPGAAQHALPLKPLANVAQLRDRLDALAARGSGSVTVVGGGLAGLEVAFAMRTRLDARLGSARSRDVSVAILTRDTTLLPDRPALAARVQRALVRRGITCRVDVMIDAVHADHLQLGRAADVSSDLTVWATGAEPPAWLRESGLPTDARGFLLVDEHLRTGATHVFAAGDCATPRVRPDTAKAGVYAVRMGPVLARTLAATVAGRRLPAPYTPQRHFLTLIDTGDGRAIAHRAGWTAEGRWVMTWKDHLDRRFVRRFQSR
ncbi:MAG: FAD-dependent oxidoreductase [Gemmatimonadaceae bacterium]|jgi:selenide,water dikinase|nr:FAD-dependent oxidoreductase [Gemmatimonadaceae bacterium]